MLDRPGDELRADILGELELERLRARKLDRTADPGEILLHGIEKASRPKALVDQHTIARPALGNAGGSRHGKALEGGDALFGNVEFACHIDQLRAVVDGQCHQQRDFAGKPGRAQWTWFRSASLRSARSLLPCLRKYCSSVKVGISGEQSRRETAKAPQALAQVAEVSCSSP